jgi:HK97 family phage portal protein
MGIIDSVLGRFGYKRDAIQGDHGRFPMAYAADMRWHMPDPEVFANQADLYRKLSWINSAVSIKAQAGAAVKFSVKRRRGEDTTDINNHPFEMRLEQPNPLMSRAEFFETAFSFYSLTKNCYIWLNRADEFAQPDEMWIIPTNEIIPVPDGKLFIKGYEYTPSNSGPMMLAPWEVVHVKGFNPHNLFVGLSPVEAVARQAYGDLGATEQESKLYNEQNGNPPGILAFADNYSDAEWQDMNREIEERARKMKKFLMIRNTKQGGVNWLQTAMSKTDLQYLEARRFTKEEIYDVFAPGLASMLAVNATEANSKSGKATFSEYAVWPMLEAFAQKITSAILPSYGLKLIGMFDDIRTKERALELQEMAEYAKTHTIEEVRRKYYQDDPLGDERDRMLPAQITANSGILTQEEKPKPAQTAPEPQQIIQIDEQSIDDRAQSEPDDDDMALEMKRWKRVARKALKAGKSANVPFTSSVISQDYQDIIRDRLAVAKSSDDIEAAFVIDDKRPDPIMMLANEIRLAREALSV